MSTTKASSSYFWNELLPENNVTSNGGKRWRASGPRLFHLEAIPFYLNCPKERLSNAVLQKMWKWLIYISLGFRWECIGMLRGAKGPYLPKKIENIVILCFERRFSKQNSVIRLKSNILTPQIFCTPSIFELATPLWEWHV